MFTYPQKKFGIGILNFKILELSGECFLDSASRLLPDQAVYTDNTPQKCIWECKKKGFAYAGVEYGNQCYCGNTRPPTSALLDPSQCNYRCEGDNSQMCGGLNWQMNVFKIGKSDFFYTRTDIYCDPLTMDTTVVFICNFVICNHFVLITFIYLFYFKNHIFLSKLEIVSYYSIK